MNKIRVIGMLLLVTILAVDSVWMQSGGAFQIEKSVIAGGGGRSAGGAFTLNGTIAQSVAGTNSSGGGFQVAGGFWGAGGPKVFLGPGAGGWGVGPVAQPVRGDRRHRLAGPDLRSAGTTRRWPAVGLERAKKNPRRSCLDQRCDHAHPEIAALATRRPVSAF